jgi:hypothetical protein
MDVRCFEGREEKKGGQICGCDDCSTKTAIEMSQ